MVDILHTHINTSCEDELGYIVNLWHICFCVTSWQMYGTWFADCWHMVDRCMAQWFADGWHMVCRWLAHGLQMVGTMVCRWLAHGLQMYGPSDLQNMCFMSTFYICCIKVRPILALSIHPYTTPCYVEPNVSTHVCLPLLC